ncbi:3-oxoacyl-[acyl-carrier-protein] synthase III C-terminal domain-containing protein [Mycobacteroides saopaulense]|nr:3-oxoacyl-[acyl-carrier-protein] synthase III C-terminal domain-containing protein [Mycobacteroides saopaulense]
MTELAASQIEPALLNKAADSLAGSFHCGSLFQGEHFWPIQNSLQQSILKKATAGSASEIRQFCSGGLFGVMLADAILRAAWSGDYAMVTGGDSNIIFDRYEYAESAATEGSLMGDSAFCTILNKHEGFAEILAVSARSYNPSADQMRSRTDYGIDDPSFPELADWTARFTGSANVNPQLAAHNARESFNTAVSTIIDCYQRAGFKAEEIDWFAPSFIKPRYMAELLAKRSHLQLNHRLYELGERFGHLTVSDFCLNLAYLMNNNIAKIGDLVLLFSSGNFVNSAAVLIRIEEEVQLPFNVAL